MKTFLKLSLILFFCYCAIESIVFAGDVLSLGVQAPTHPLGDLYVDPNVAQAYFNANPDVAASSYGYSALGAWQHYVERGQFEGRGWPGAVPERDKRILPYCGAPNTGGSNCLVFSAGAKLGAIAWDSSVKAGNSEILAILFFDGPGISRQLLLTHHLGISAQVKTITFPEPIDIPTGSDIWIYADGWSDPHDGGFEAQVNLFFLGSGIQAILH